MEVQAGPSDFSLRSGSVPGRCGHAPSPEPREKIKIPGSERPQYFLKRSKGGKVTGGTFTAFSIKPGIKYLVNVGSVGQPRDGLSDAAYVVYDAGCRTVELRRIGYPRPPSGGDGVGKPVPRGGGSPDTFRACNDIR
jgi:hypothetical protein